ncbi:hypothetical protein [Stutzerimonas frequens]|uniref:hypothetical protein n=1 Tax=Stutzerimonas frequens TaxID=2968969 RepID=UPI00190D0065|nr:hypothetical protein [Stutzerimonas frequens]MBK3758058.1 hypothetical protein [Stutzerimonas frequens]MBK3872204.1 hypothetical protein [Stutzerimonas frequens]MBK3910735.1 hypothetical protein [Stutzerimonas frequens]MBK3930015.1 hypothetical protein [Stutzerimonas frequens]
MSIPFWLAMAGWAFTYLNSRSLARQAEANSIVAAVDKMLQEISDENYKFWKDAKSEEENHSLNCQLFHAYINFRCNFIEKRLTALYSKCRNKVLFDGHADEFYPQAIEAISLIRSIATLDSEKSSTIDSETRRRKILLINKHTLEFHDLVSRFMLERYRPVVDFRGKPVSSDKT